MNKEQFNNLYQPQYNNFFSMIHNIGPDLNSRKNRFDKSDLIEIGFAASTRTRLTWVDKIGYDLIDANNIKYELKSEGNLLYTEKLVKKKENTAIIKLTNTLQKSANNKKLSKTADYLILVDSKAYSVAIIDYQTVIDEYSTEVADGFTCQIPTNKLTFLITPSEVEIKLYENVNRYSDVKAAALNEYVVSFF